MNLGQQLANNDQTKRAKHPMPPTLFEKGSLPHQHFSDKFYKKLLADTQNTEGLFDGLKKKIEKQIQKRKTDPECWLLHCKNLNEEYSDRRLRVAAIVQNHETWQEFIQWCIENDLVAYGIDFTDDEVISLRLRFSFCKTQ
ncbi:MAG: hypothetical protein AAB556_00570 [Patescibacteria group bacterium]